MSVKKCACRSPLAPDSAFRKSEKFSHFALRHSAEEPALDKLSLPGIQRCKPGERLVQLEHIHIVWDWIRYGTGNWLVRRISSANLSSLLPRMIYQNLAHHLGCNGQEMRAIVPRFVLLPGQLQIRFVNEGRWLQRMVVPFSIHLPHGNSAQMFVENLKRLLLRTAIAVGDSLQNFCDFACLLQSALPVYGILIALCEKVTLKCD